jgi:hypothetical protein
MYLEKWVTTLIGKIKHEILQSCKKRPFPEFPWHFFKLTNMIAHSKNHTEKICDTDPVGMIAVCLAGRFAKPLFDFYNENTYSAYVKCLKEILIWSQEFHDLHYKNEEEWEVFENTRKNIYNNGFHQRDLLIAWGGKRIEQFFAQHTSETGYSRKYRNNSKRKQNISNKDYHKSRWEKKNAR